MMDAVDSCENGGNCMGSENRRMDLQLITKAQCRNQISWRGLGSEVGTRGFYIFPFYFFPRQKHVQKTVVILFYNNAKQN